MLKDNFILDQITVEDIAKKLKGKPALAFVYPATLLAVERHGHRGSSSVQGYAVQYAKDMAKVAF